MSVIMVASKSVIAQSIETIRGSNPPDQLEVGGQPQDIAVNEATNKIYILSPAEGTVTVLDSNSGTVKNILVGISPLCLRNCIGVDQANNKIYVANTASDTVSVIDGNNDTVKKNIHVGVQPAFILVASEYKIYVANTASDTVSVIDSNNDTVKKNIHVGHWPTFILPVSHKPSGKFGLVQPGYKIYVACNDAKIYVINPDDDTVEMNITLPGLAHLARLAYIPQMYMDFGVQSGYELYVLWYSGAPVFSYAAYRIELPYRPEPTNDTVKQIPFTSALQHVFPGLYAFPHYLPGAVQDVILGKEFIINRDNGTVSVDCTGGLNTNLTFTRMYCSSHQKQIVVGQHPGPIAINDMKHIVYIGHPSSGTVSVINGFTDRVAVGVIFNVNPPDSGAIKCDGRIYPTNTYIYVDSGVDCTAQNNKGFEFNTWTESPLTNRNSTTPIEQSPDHPETIPVTEFGIFTANFKLPHHLTTEELLGWLTIAITAAVAVNGVILLIPGWRRTRNQRTHLKECIHLIDDDVGKSHKDAIEDKIMGYYVDGKLSEDHRQLLKDKVSEYYGQVIKGTESGT